eukprot:6485990-Alexandrium_andersonii.AAC.1
MRLDDVRSWASAWADPGSFVRRRARGPLRKTSAATALFYGVQARGCLNEPQLRRAQAILIEADRQALSLPRPTRSASASRPTRSLQAWARVRWRCWARSWRRPRGSSCRTAGSP